MTDSAARNLEAAPTQERIKAVAASLYVLKGYEGFSFGDIADEIETAKDRVAKEIQDVERILGKR